MAGRQRRSIKNVVLTKKYHMAYMGTSIFLSLSLLCMLYGLFLYRFLELFKADAEFPIKLAVLTATAVTVFVGLLIIGSNILAAHRIAGVHIKLRQMFDKVEQGDLSTRIRFRSDDKLDDVEEAFNAMMGSLEERFGEVTAEE